MGGMASVNSMSAPIARGMEEVQPNSTGVINDVLYGRDGRDATTVNGHEDDSLEADSAILVAEDISQSSVRTFMMRRVMALIK
jgi:hypothetical protein